MQNTHIDHIRAIYSSVVELVMLMNQPQRDALMIEEAGISLDRALFPLLVGIGRFGPIGVVELADKGGRDYTTVSRQLMKLESLGLIERRPSAGDKRVREAVITAAGQEMTDAINQARDRMLTRMLADWSGEDLELLSSLMRRLVDSALAGDS